MESTIPRLMRKIATEHPDLPAQMFKDGNDEFQPISYSEFHDQVRRFAAGLKKHGVSRGDRVGLISDNRQEWFITDIALHSLGAADVPRGCDSNADEISYILAHAECSLSVLENTRQLEKVVEKKKDLPKLKEIIILDPDFDASAADTGGFNVFNYADVMTAGADTDLAEIDAEIDKGNEHDVVTLIYTSGTTGEPKGVQLSHKNFLHQVEWTPTLIPVGPGDRWLSVLPVWHSFERIMQYVALGTASALCYSKPVGSILLADMQKVKPTWMASVPRIWESVRDGIYRNVNQAGGVKKALFLFFVAVGSTWKTCSNMVNGLMPRYKKRIRLLDFLVGIIPFILLWPLKTLGGVLVFKTIKQKLGGRFVAGISGGGGLPAHVDAFFQAAGITLIEGYGLTETAPVLSLRDYHHQVPGTIGPAFPGTELKIITEDGSIAAPGEPGVLYARGPQVMKGYFKRDDLTSEMLDKEGWLNTGDISMMTQDGEYAIVGRAKDTIVLLGGENIEPAPIEEKLKVSTFISTPVVVGQDQKYLGALILVDQDNVKAWAKENNVPYIDDAGLYTSPEVHELLSSEISELVSSKTGFKIFERVVKFSVLPVTFEIGRELSAKQEIKRFVIADLYSKEIAGLFS